MKKMLVTLTVLVILLSGLAMAQDANEEYIKIMQMSDNCQKVAGLKAFLAKYSGQGSQYENYAWAYLCVLPCNSKTADETVKAGEKALAAGGFDDDMKVTIMATICQTYVGAGQMDKAKAEANQLMEFAHGKKTSDAANAAKWAKLEGAGHVLIGQALEKTDPAGAADEYINAYQIGKDPGVAALLGKLGKTLYDAGKYADAEKIFRQFYATAQDAESAVILGQTLYKAGKTDEALAIYKEAYGKKKTANLASNIAIILNNKLKTDPSVKEQTIDMFIEAGLLYKPNTKESKNMLGMAQNLFIGDNPELKAAKGKVDEHNEAIKQYTQTYNERFGGKSEDDMTDLEKSTAKKLQAAIDQEKAAIEQINSQLKSVIDKFNQRVVQVRARMGK